MLSRRIDRILVASALFVALGLAGVGAQTTQPAGPVGTWKWSNEGFGGQQETVLKIKQDGDKLSGTITGFGGEEGPIADIKFADGKLTFKVVRDFGGRNFTTMYEGKIEGATFKGKSQAIFEQDIDAKRDK